MPEVYNDLIFQLGDLAREHLADHPRPPKAMEAVFAAEDAVLAERDQLNAIEKDINAVDRDFQDYLAQVADERAELKEITTRWKVAVAGVEVRTRDMKKKLSSLKAALRYNKVSAGKAEERHKDLEVREGHDYKKIGLSASNLKKLKLQIMRDQRTIDELVFDFNQILTPRSGQQGAQGIIAHKRVLEIEDEIEEAKFDHDEKMKLLDAELAAKDEDVKACEAELDACLFDLGEEVYGERILNPKLNPVYVRLDKAK
jgi:hypothetical protein